MEMTPTTNAVPVLESVSPPTSNRVDWLRTWLRGNWAIVFVLAVFFAVAPWVNVLTPVATTDDWGYSRASEILLHERHLEVFPVVAATSVFQIVWGALFALFFDNSLGAVRLSTLVMSAIGGLALYDMCRRLRVPAGRSALVVAAYLFNPLTFVLSYSFMTDPHFTSVLLVAAALTMRSLGKERQMDEKWLIAGSVAAAAAILIRQQGVLIPLSIAAYFLLSGEIRFARSGLRRLLEIGFIPALATFGYLAWLRLVNGVPDVQSSFAAEIGDAGVRGSARLVGSLTYFEIMYIGFFVLPLTAAMIVYLPSIVRGIQGRAWLIAIAWSAVAVAGIVYFADTRRRMPYLPQFMGSGGLGPPDVRGSRPRLFEQPWFDGLTAVSLVSTILLALVIASAISSRSSELRRGPGLIAALLAGQVAGVIPPSFHYLNRGDSLDRYLLPLMPLMLVVAAWALNDFKIVAPIGWAVALAFALFAIVGTRDYLTYLDAVWDAADYAIDAGARPDQIDAGAAWDGYHLYTDGVDQGITRALTRDGPWWTYFYGKATDSSYVVSGRLLPGYALVTSFQYSSILQDDPTRVYLLRRHTAPWPPVNAGG